MGESSAAVLAGERVAMIHPAGKEARPEGSRARGEEPR
jgi:hypothetical protein